MAFVGAAYLYTDSGSGIAEKGGYAWNANGLSSSSGAVGGFIENVTIASPPAVSNLFSLINPNAFYNVRFNGVSSLPPNLVVARGSESNETYPGSPHTNQNVDHDTPPNPESGYVPPKKRPKDADPKGKVRNPNGPGSGWRAKDGGVWMPEDEHDGGAGWTVQYPGGRHEHRYPDGHRRVHKIQTEPNSLTPWVIAIIVVAVVAIFAIALAPLTGGASLLALAFV